VAAIQTHIPGLPLQKVVPSISYLQGLGTGIALQRVYQAIIINMGDHFRTSSPYDNDIPVENCSDVWINGMHHLPFALENVGEAQFYVIGVRPGMMSKFMRVPVAESNHTALDARFWADESIFRLREQLLGMQPDEGFRLIETYLGSQLTDIGPELSLVDYLDKALPIESVQTMCDELGCTRKTLRSYAVRYFGAPVKEMQGIMRFDAHLRAIATDPERSLSSIHRFYDQAHFINDFRARTGMTPKQYRRLCQHVPAIRYTPNFIPLPKETFLQFLASEQA
jgi:AraC-like DNA-binding protein